MPPTAGRPTYTGHSTYPPANQPAGAPAPGYGGYYSSPGVPAAAPPYHAWSGPGGPPPPGWQPGAPRNDGSRKALVAVAVVCAVVAGAFATVNLAAGGQSGAASPDEATESFFDAVSDEDLIGVLDMLDPGERDVLMPFVQNLESELTRLAITEDMNLDDVPGLDLEIEGLATTTTELAPGLAEVTITEGVLTTRTEPEAVPIGDVLRDLIEANDGEVDIPEEQDSTELGEDDPFLIAVETDGRWHLSLFFTVAEYARRDAGYPLPDMGTRVTPQGAASPEEAVRQLIDAATALDLERMIALLPPGEMRALQTYAPLFLPDAQAGLDDFRAEDDFSASVEGLEFETSSIDGGTRVMPTAATVTITSDEGDMTVDYRDGCVEVTGEMAEDFGDEFGDTRICREDVEDLGGDLSEEARAELHELWSVFEGYEAGVVVVEVDGAYYVSPLRTFGDLLLQVLGVVERSDLEEGGILYRLFTGDLSAFDEFGGYDDYDDEFDCEPDDEDC